MKKKGGCVVKLLFCQVSIGIAESLSFSEATFHFVNGFWNVGQ